MSEQAKPTTGRTVLILVGWSLLACVSSVIGSVFDSTVSAVVWFGVLLAGIATYRKVPLIRNTLIFFVAISGLYAVFFGL